MKNMKRLLSSLLAVAMMLSLAACGSGGTTTSSSGSAGTDASTSTPVEDSKVTLVYAEVNPLDSIVGQTGVFFKEKK